MTRKKISRMMKAAQEKYDELMEYMLMSIEKVFVVDDEKDVVLLIKTILEKNGYDVSTAYDGEDALAQIQTLMPDLVISDVIMPRMNGMELVSNLKSNEQTRDIPVILLTQKDSFDDIHKAYRLGTSYYLPKPFDQNILLKAITEIEASQD